MTEAQMDTVHPVKVAVVYHSGYGNTAKQASAVAMGAKEVPGVDVMLISVDQIEEHWQDLDDAAAIIFGSPTYFGGLSADFKAFMEATSSFWKNDLPWRNKLAGGFTNSMHMSGDKLNTLLTMAIFAMQHGMQWVGLDIYAGWGLTNSSPDDLNRLGSWLGAMAQSNGDSDAGPSPSDLKTAAYLGSRIAQLAKQWVAGREAATVSGRQEEIKQ